mmetsp:Transcript_40330/g.38798  ORF Transcript_40330/g.38798 Transcript_40330/m.38798 type:complete len:144 (-) Transcript_40330:9-440(-)
MCLIGIAHLPEGMNKLRYYRTFEVRPTISTNIMEMVNEEMSKTPKHAGIVSMNLFWAIKMICDKTLHIIPISGNIEYEPETNLNDDEMVNLEEEEKQDGGGSTIKLRNKFDQVKTLNDTINLEMEQVDDGGVGLNDNMKKLLI